jgi:hypothetical protein
VTADPEGGTGRPERLEEQPTWSDRRKWPGDPTRPDRAGGSKTSIPHGAAPRPDQTGPSPSNGESLRFIEVSMNG